VTGWWHNAPSSSTFELAEMSKGSHTFRRVTLNHSVSYAWDLRWDGADLAIGDGTNVDDVAISGTNGRLRGVVPLDGDYALLQFWLRSIPSSALSPMPRAFGTSRIPRGLTDEDDHGPSTDPECGNGKLGIKAAFDSRVLRILSVSF